MAAKAPYYKAPIAAPVYDWTGFYIGVNAGGGFGRSYTQLGAPSGFGGGDAASRVGGAGGVGGAQIGYNKQYGSLLGFNNLVLGVEADIQGAGLQDSRTCEYVCYPLVGGFGINQNLDWFGTARGRVGIATGPVLSYFTGGFAAGGVKTTITDVTAPGAATTFNNTREGWTIGSGVEAALGGNWTAKLEYLYVDLGSQSGSNFAAVNPYNFSSEIREHIFRVGLNYHPWGPGGAGLGGMWANEPVANWSGFYLGANAGGATSLDRTSLTLPPPAFVNEQFNLSPDGYLGGGQIGYNWQAGHVLFGLEADAQYSSQRDDKACELDCVPGLARAAFDQKLNWLATARARVGYAVGSSLFYATGGFAYGGVSDNASGFVGPVVAFNQTNTHSQGGYAVGGGIESPFDLFGWFGKNWTAKTEYLYVDLGHTTDVIPLGPSALTVTSHIQENIFRTGLNYHFNTPVIARY